MQTTPRAVLGLALFLAACGNPSSPPAVSSPPPAPAKPHVAWIHKPADGFAKARQEHKPILLDFGAPG